MSQTDYIQNSAKNSLHNNCKELLKAFKSGQLGQTIMPEDNHPTFTTEEEKLT